MTTTHRAKRASDGCTVLFWCPGCRTAHSIMTPTWSWNGSEERPTFSPSILVRWHGYPKGIDPAPGETQQPGPQVCHSFVRDGRIQYLPDSTHALAGQTVDLPEWKGAS